ncbi:MAG: T9SS type A sorting domain-containing protein [Bacteroidales bacterium]
MRSIYISILLFLSVGLSAQEVVTGLQFNPVVRMQYLKNKMLKSGTGADSIPMQLPFYDDFSSGEVFPSPLRWIDHDAFVNTDYPVYPIDLGVVTLDAINDSGSIYSTAVGGPDNFIADHLTSRYIRLDSVFSPVPRALSPADSVYLSFYYQPQGRGLAPHSSDSLVLQFLTEPHHDSISPVDTTPIPDRWERIWSVKGMALDSFYILNNHYFLRVMIPITNPKYFKKDFRFQFFNYVSLASNEQPSWQSNCCQWNIDQVYLNYGRNMFDTIHKEIRFVERPPSLLKSYQAMPYPQFCNNPSNEMIDSLSILITNRDSVTHSIKYSYQVAQPGGNFSKSYISSATNLLPYSQYAFGYVAYPPIPFTFPIGQSDSTQFEVEHIVHDLTPGSLLADTITGHQLFYNYYAYDDGTAEAGYGLKGTGGEMAYRFKLNKSPDTLRAIRILFNHTMDTANIQNFYLTVWSDNSGIPGDTIYSRQVITKYSDSLNQFTNYLLETPVVVNGSFYIGTIQTTDDNLNIGLDTYDNAASNLFYNVTGTWMSSAITGAPMIRPVIGKRLPLGIDNLKSGQGSLKIYPNPCSSGQVHISLNESGTTADKGNWDITISSLTGQQVYYSSRVDIVDVSALTSGVYFIKVNDLQNFQTYISKLIIMK